MAAIRYNEAAEEDAIQSTTLYANVLWLTAEPSPREQGEVRSGGMLDGEDIDGVNPTYPSSTEGMHGYIAETTSPRNAIESVLPISETIGVYSTSVPNGYEPKIGTTSYRLVTTTDSWENETDYWNATEPVDNLSGSSPARDIIVGTLLSLVCFAVVFGNALVVLAIYREKYLRTTTNFFIASLACADFFIGSIVLPFAIYQELRPSEWVFGYAWCDAWHAIDICLSTASIMNLTVIAVDRFWAITMPMNYPTKMTKKLGACLISVVWIVSSLISFPCIAWWHAVEPVYPPNDCIFPENATYLILSSCISFYIPSITMIILYWKVFVTATEQVRSLRSGTKKFGGHEGQMMRIHRGGNSRIERNPLQRKMNGSTANGSPCPKYGTMGVMMGHEKKKFFSGMAKEHKAAKTLGIVMGVFILCWLPFFIVNVTAPLCFECILAPNVTFPIVVWLGYANSACNPVIYAFTSRSYKRAFRRILCLCFPGMKKRKDPWRRGRLISMSNMSSADSSMTLVDYGIVMGVFILCWLPFFIVNVTAPLCFECILAPNVTFPIVVWLGYANNACNPVIYAFTSRSYKRAFRRILCLCFPGMKKRKDPWSRGRLISMSNMSSADSSMTLGESIRITVLDGSKPPTTITAHKYTLPKTYF